MRFLGRSQHHPSMPYALHPPYAEARAALLARRPLGNEARPFGDLFAVATDVGLEHYLVSVYLFADGTISVYSSGLRSRKNCQPSRTSRIWSRSRSETTTSSLSSDPFTNILPRGSTK